LYSSSACPLESVCAHRGMLYAPMFAAAQSQTGRPTAHPAWRSDCCLDDFQVAASAAAATSNVVEEALAAGAAAAARTAYRVRAGHSTHPLLSCNHFHHAGAVCKLGHTCRL
jgi:hypothetical protein